jgi:hypothetical protein
VLILYENRPRVESDKPVDLSGLPEDEARKAGRNKQFATTAENRTRAIRSIHSHIRKLQRNGYPEEAITSVVQQMTGGLANQLYNMPLDMIIEYWHHVTSSYSARADAAWVKKALQREWTICLIAGWKGERCQSLMTI